MKTIALFLGISVLAIPAIASDPDWDKKVLGIATVPLSENKDLLSQFKFKPPASNGLLIVGIDQNGPAAKAGLGLLDVITKIGSTPVKTSYDVDRSFEGSVDQIKVQGFRRLPNGKWKEGKVDCKIVTYKEFVLESTEVNIDEVDGKMLIVHKQEEKGRPTESSMLLQIIKPKGEKPFLCVQFNRISQKLLMPQNYTLANQGNSLKLSGFLGNGSTDFQLGSIYEWHIHKLTNDEVAFIENIPNSNKVILRSSSSSVFEDREISDQEKFKMKIMLDRFKLAEKAQ